MTSYAEERAAKEAAERARWAKKNAHHPIDRLPVQMHGVDGYWKYRLHGGVGRMATVPRNVAEAAWQGYAADGHGRQDSETLHGRGGFGLGELGYYLARAVDEGLVEIRLTDRAFASAQSADAHGLTSDKEET